MRGVDFAKFIETELANRGIKKGDFYNATGLTATAMYNWKRGSVPSRDSIEAVEKFFGMKISEAESARQFDPEIAELLEGVKDRQDLKMLFRSAKDLPPSSVYEILAEIERRKENASG